MKTCSFRIGITYLLLAATMSLLSAQSRPTLTLTDPQAVSPAARAINALGIDLLRRTAQETNALLSPYSIQSTLAMAYAGADGRTRDEMTRVLYYPTNEVWLHLSFSGLRQVLDGLEQQSLKLATANRLFGQKGYAFREPLLRLLRDYYAAPFETLDFVNDSEGATKHINNWVENQTQQHIRNVIPNGALCDLTRLVLVNAIYFKAAWQKPFDESETTPQPFRLADGKVVNVPTMIQQEKFYYQKCDRFSLVGLRYAPGALQFLILLPDTPNGLPALESQLTPGLLLSSANLKATEVKLSLPKFKLEPPVMALSRELKQLGMKTAFDDPPGSANFDRMAPRRPDDYLYVWDIFHNTTLSLDEKGTEATAATAIIVGTLGIHEPVKPIEVKVDRPFLFAIQDIRNGTCLFFGRMADPR